MSVERITSIRQRRLKGRGFSKLFAPGPCSWARIRLAHFGAPWRSLLLDALEYTFRRNTAIYLFTTMASALSTSSRILIFALWCQTLALAKVIGKELSEYLAREQFSLFETRFQKTYSSPSEREDRFWIFVANMQDVVEKNAALKKAGLDEIHGMTKFSDWTRSEYETMVAGSRKKSIFDTIQIMKDISVTDVAVPSNCSAQSFVDWRTKGVVTPVKDQGRCGSCWAHSAVEAIESQRALAGMPLEALSVQQLVSCDDKNDGCDGGWYYTAWDFYVENAGGLALEEDYPYDRRTYAGYASQCDTSLAADTAPDSDVTKFEWATAPCTSLMCNHQDEDTLKKNLVSYGPISIACDASEWSSYTGGVITRASCSRSDAKLDHAVQLVGYNEEPGHLPYWIVRNSWNTDWGLDGYLYLAMGGNTCGIADKAALVKLEDSHGAFASA